MCDDSCDIKQIELKRIAEQQERVKREQEEEKNRKELIEFEKKFGKRKHKEKKTQITEVANDSHLFKWILVAIAVAGFAILVWYSFQSISI